MLDRMDILERESERYISNVDIIFTGDNIILFSDLIAWRILLEHDFLSLLALKHGPCFSYHNPWLVFVRCTQKCAMAYFPRFVLFVLHMGLYFYYFEKSCYGLYSENRL